MNGDGVGTVHCVNISLLQEANVRTNQQFNVTLLLLTADITVYFKGRTTIILIFNTGEVKEIYCHICTEFTHVFFSQQFLIHFLLQVCDNYSNMTN